MDLNCKEDRPQQQKGEERNIDSGRQPYADGTIESNLIVCLQSNRDRSANEESS